MTEMDELRAGQDKVKALAEAIEKEMDDEGNQGNIWENRMCKAWPEYKRAVDNQQMLRAKYGV